MVGKKSIDKSLTFDHNKIKTNFYMAVNLIVVQVKLPLIYIVPID